MDIIYTSYFANRSIRNYPNLVSIANKSVPGFNGRMYPSLYPGWKIFSEYKRTGSELTYIRSYNQILHALDPYAVFKDLRNCILLCWETPDKFCHRHLVSMWLRANLGIEVRELSLSDDLMSKSLNGGHHGYQ